MAFWVEFEGRPAACLEGTEAEVRVRAAALGTVKSVKPLPYPAEPRPGPRGSCPSFCWQPAKCAGFTACPRPYACSE